MIAILTSVLLSLLSTVVMSYISMAIPIGPWIAPTIVLLALAVFKGFSCYSNAAVSRYSALATCAASVGGILATGIGFSYPAIYFLDQSLFNRWLEYPFYFSFMLSGLAASAGAFGIWLAHLLSDRLVKQEKLAFPIGELVHKMISAHQSVRKSWELVAGFVSTAIFCVLQDGIGVVRGYIPKAYTLLSPTTLGVISIPLIRFDLWPLLWAIGFVTGHVIAVPLALGAIAKIGIIDVLNNLFFPTMSGGDFVLAFCSGMVLVGTLQGFAGIPATLVKSIKRFWSHNAQRSTEQYSSNAKAMVIEGVVVVGLCVAYLSYLHFSFVAQGYVILLTAIVSYQLAIIAGKIGLAPLGRFATFVMVPALFLFNLDTVQIIVIATFVEICGGVVADALFGIKMAQLGEISLTRLKRYQYLGLLVSAAVVGIIFWLLISHFHLGSAELFAQKAQARALLINAHSFSVVVVLIGAVFGFALKYSGVNPALLLSGILMPLNISLGLVIGGFLTRFVHNKEEWYPFWSGIFAANSVWMLLRTLF